MRHTDESGDKTPAVGADAVECLTDINRFRFMIREQAAELRRRAWGEPDPRTARRMVERAVRFEHSVATADERVARGGVRGARAQLSMIVDKLPKAAGWG